MKYRFNPDEELRKLEQAVLTGDEDAPLQLYYARLRYYQKPCTPPNWNSMDVPGPERDLVGLRDFIEETHNKLEIARQEIYELESKMTRLITKEVNLEKRLG